MGNSNRLGQAWVVLAFLLAFTGCDFDRSGIVPSFFSVDSLVPADTSGKRVTVQVPTRVITDYALYIDGQFVGAYELGLPFDSARAPIPYSGRHRVTIYGMVRADGLRSQRVQYLFWQGDTSTHTFTPESRLDLRTLKLRQHKSLVDPLPLNETFETLPLAVDSGPSSALRVQVKKDTLDHPGSFGYVFAPGGKSHMLQLAAKKAVSGIPQNTNKPLYAEIDYRSTVPFTVGFYYLETGSVKTVADIIVKPNPGGWKRVYVYLSDEAVIAPQGSALQFFILGVNEPTIGATIDTTKDNYIAVDNIRLLHLKN